MAGSSIEEHPVWKKLSVCAREMQNPDRHLRHLCSDPRRFERFSRSGETLFYDMSRQRIDETVLSLLIELAETTAVQDKFRSMMDGAQVNGTENRSALHTAARDFSERPIMAGKTDAAGELRAVREKIRAFSEMIRNGALKGSTGKAFRHAVVVGIGGSYLGTEFVSTALTVGGEKGPSLHYLSNVDIDNFGCIAEKIDPEATLWIIISKSYTTAETLANTRLAYGLLKKFDLDPSRHVVTVTAKGSPGDDPASPVLETFHMFDYIGGRYSVTSAVGGVPLSLCLGYDRFEAFLQGAGAMDRHAATAPPDQNLPLLAALLSIWNINFLQYPAAAIIPYSSALSKLAAHVQQLNMESNGKGVDETGAAMEVDTGPIIFGEPGTNAQHSFFQLAHQGRPFPIEFIGIVRPRFSDYDRSAGGVTNHQELWANLIAQADALALGGDAPQPARRFPGNRPSATLVLPDLSPESVGRLLSFYEAKTVFEAFIWGINPFDQFGVELGKKTASGIRREMERKNETPHTDFSSLPARTRHYLQLLFDR